MVTNNEAVENFLNGKRNLAAYQFSHLIKESANATKNHDEIAFNYAMVNLFTGCPQRASIIFSELVKRYPRNPRLWLRLAESMLAAERSKMTDEFEHIQQTTNPHSREHIIKTKNRPILIKVNPNYCHQQKLQHLPNRAPEKTPKNFLVNIKAYLQKSLNLINEYNDISLLTDDIPNMDAIQQARFSESPYSESPTTSSSSQLRASSELSQQLSYINPYKSISRSALYHLRIKVQLNLAYTCLCTGEPMEALNYTTQCLKASPQGYEKVLASLYHAEACILVTRVDEAIQFLNLEVLNMAKNLSQGQSTAISNSKQRVVYGGEMQNQFDRGALALVVTYNLSVAYAAKGEFTKALKILMKCLQPTKPIPMPLVICLLYIQLQLGQVEAAKKTILGNLPQFSEAY
jgi:tetratricopeptide (TPR) repeat protein